MCIPNSIQHKIHKRTGNGDMIAIFLVDTMQGQHTDAKFNHRLEAAKHLIKYGFPDTGCDTISDRLSRAGGNPEGQGGDETPVQSPLSPRERARVRGTENTPSPSTGEGWDGGDESLPSVSVSVTHLDILNYQIAHLIRHETAEGHTIVNFLVDIMTGRDRPFTPKKFRIKPADRMAAARELLRRGFGDLGSHRKLSDSQRRSQTPTTPCTPTSPRECASTASAAPTPSASSWR